MTLDLTPFARRVHAAVTTNQCLDYAADVQILIHEVEKYQRGESALEDWVERLRLRASVGKGITYQEMKAAGQAYRTAAEALETFGGAS